MSIQNAPFENIQPELEIDVSSKEALEKSLEQVDYIYKLLHGRHNDSEKKDY